MDRLESLTTQLSQITMYDIKSMYNQAKNVVLNVSEMEAKVREATNDEPWGASSTLMQEIAQGTFNFQNFNEIMPCIYARFMEKEARQWRQIYKALQLLEYLIKNGSERVVDDARSHISTVKMLRNFHYIDDKGKDEGVNVRNRSRELVEMLSDVEKIRTERRKAKTNRHKYIGTGNEGLSFSSGGSRYSGFGSDSVGGGSYSGGGYERDYNNYSSGGSGGFRDEARRGGFEEYNAGDDETPRRSNSIRGTATSVASPRRSNTVPPAPKAKEPVKEVDLLGGFGDDDDIFSSESASAPSTEKALPILNSLDADDDFADFQAAPVSPVVNANPTKPTLMEMLSNSPVPTTATHRSTPSYSQPSYQAAPIQPTAFQNASFGTIAPNRQSFSAQPTQNLFGGAPISAASLPPRTTPAPAAKSSSGNFDDLWTMSLGSTTKSSATKTGSSGAGKSIKDLEKEKAQAGIWGAQKPAGAGSGLNLGASFGGSGTTTAAGNGGDDLLL